MLDTYFAIYMLLCTYTQKKIGREEMRLFRWPTLIWLKWLIWLQTGRKMHRKAFVNIQCLQSTYISHYTVIIRLQKLILM